MSLAINLLPPEYRPRRRSLPKTANLAIILGCLTLALYLIFLIQWGLASRRAALLEKQLALYEPQVQQATSSKNTAGEWQQKEQALQRLAKERRLWHPILAAINGALPGEVWLTRLEENEAQGELVLGGESISLQAIGVFLNNLQGMEAWQEVTLQEIKGNGASLSFVIRAVFKGGQTGTGKKDTASSGTLPGNATKLNGGSPNADGEGKSS